MNCSAIFCRLWFRVPRVAMVGVATACIATAGAIGIHAALTGSAVAQERPAGFVALADVDPTILQDIRYATANNFTGAKVPGYETGSCSLTRNTAAALARVQREVLAEGLSLKVYDCYRPQVATNAFVVWAAGEGVGGPGASTEKPNRYYPRVQRNRLIVSGYISAQSNHTKGTTVDLTLIHQSHPDGVATEPPLPLEHECGAPSDGSVDMGTGYDCLDAKSHLGAAGVTAAQQRWRRKLAAVMLRHGFRGYFREWWHFTYERDR